MSFLNSLKILETSERNDRAMNIIKRILILTDGVRLEDVEEAFDDIDLVLKQLAENILDRQDNLQVKLQNNRSTDY